MSTSFSLFLLLDIVSLVAALPAGGSGGTRGGSGSSSSGDSKSSSPNGSSGGSSSGSSGSTGGKSGTGWTSSRNHGQRAGPLSNTAKIVLAVIGGLIGLGVLIILIVVVVSKFKKRKLEAKHHPALEKAGSSESSSRRTSVDEPTLSHNPGHTQAAVHRVSHPTTNSELTSAVMEGEGSRAGHGEDGAGSGSRGGVGSIPWEARALSVVSKGMSNASVYP